MKVPVIACPLPSQKSDNLATASSVDTYDNEIVMELSAIILRIMKTEGKLSHQQLLERTTKRTQSRLSLTPSIFKRSIQLLIEKEYIQRNADDPSYYHYLS